MVSQAYTACRNLGVETGQHHNTLRTLVCCRFTDRPSAECDPQLPGAECVGACLRQNFKWRPDAPMRGKALCKSLTNDRDRFKSRAACPDRADPCAIPKPWRAHRTPTRTTPTSAGRCLSRRLPRPPTALNPRRPPAEAPPSAPPGAPPRALPAAPPPAAALLAPRRRALGDRGRNTHC